MVTPNLIRQRNKALRPGGRTIRVHEEPLQPGVYLLRIQKQDVGAIDLNEGILEYDPRRVDESVIRNFATEYFGLTEEDIIGTEEVRY